jgi:protocatechuate 3,4-dioxygenase alpha subunit
MKRLVPSAEMTTGPFFPVDFSTGANDLTRIGGKTAEGDAIDLTGRVTQLDGRALDNVLIEIWQADAAGRFDNPDFCGWGRAATDDQGVYRFRTIRPGSPPGRLPHVNVLVLYSGLMRQLQTVIFFGNGRDPVLDAVPAARRTLLVAEKVDAKAYRFDIRLRGERETPFFDD